MIGLTKSLGKELAKTGIRVNCVTPAAVRTAIFDQMTQQHIDFMLSKIPMGRFGGVDEIAALVCWLASEECCFSTGRGVRPLGRPRDVLSDARMERCTSQRAGVAASRSAHVEHDLADVLRRFHQRVRGGRLGERKHAVDDRSSPAPRSNSGQTFARERLRDADLARGRARAQRRAGDGQPLHHDVAPVDLDAAAVQEGDDDEAALRARGTCRFFSM